MDSIWNKLKLESVGATKEELSVSIVIAYNKGLDKAISIINEYDYFPEKRAIIRGIKANKL